MKSCTVQNCGAKHYGLGLCRLHYRRQKYGKHGMDAACCLMCGKGLLGRRPQTKFCCVPCQMKWERRFGCYTAERIKESIGTCSIDGCKNPVKAYGMCGAHAQRVRRHGNPSVNLTRRTALVCAACQKEGKTFAKDLCLNCYHNAYYHENVETERPRRNARRARALIATPPWADLVAITKFYAACPPGHEVDHVIPLNGKLVSGLHVMENLQYLKVRDNRTKSNRYHSDGAMA